MRNHPLIGKWLKQQRAQALTDIHPSLINKDLIRSLIYKHRLIHWPERSDLLAVQRLFDEERNTNWQVCILLQRL